MNRTTIIRYQKHAGSKKILANKTIKHGFRLQKKPGVGIDTTKSIGNLYFLYEITSHNFYQIDKANCQKAIEKFLNIYQELALNFNKNKHRKKTFEEKHLKTPCLIEVVKTYSPILFQEWGIAKLNKVISDHNQDIDFKFKTNHDGWSLSKIIDKNKLFDWSKKLINEEANWQADKLGNDAGVIGAAVHVDERNIHIHFYSFPITKENLVQHTKLLKNKFDYSNRQKSFWLWSKEHLDNSLSLYQSKTFTNAKNISFKVWHQEQEILITNKIINLQNNYLETKKDFLALQKEKITLFDYLVKYPDTSQRSTIDSLVSVIDHLQYLCLIKTNNKTKFEHELTYDQINYWTKEKENIENLIPSDITQKLNQEELSLNTVFSNQNKS